jgi:hypothetical protein
MLRFESLSPIFRLRNANLRLPALLVLSLSLGMIHSAFGQAGFTLQMTTFSGKGTVDPGGEATSSISIVPGASFSGTVALTCQATSNQTGTPPSCEVSPASVAPPASATAIVNTVVQTSSGTQTATPGLYLITVTGTSSTATPNTVTAQAYLTVQSVAPGFTITVQSAVEPSSVHAGSGGQGIVSVNPLNGYSGTVTLACASISPLVTIPPICSFVYPPGQIGLHVNGVPATATINISTYGPIIAGTFVPTRGFFALWLPLPLLSLVGVGAVAGGKRSRKAWGLLALLVLGGSLLLLPGCGSNTSTPTSTPNGVTPNNTYTFTLVGVDTAGNVSSNTGTGTTNSTPTVTLTVD